MKKLFRRIHYVDRCLLVILAILMLQSAFTLFVNETQTQDANSIDIIVRTSSAAIFGYFISGNFHIQRERRKKEDPVSPPKKAAVKIPDPENNGKTIKNQIGFAASAASPKPLEGGADPAPGESAPRSLCCCAVQTTIVFSIGLFCLILLLLFRNFATPSPAAAGTLSQLRDFVSGCVGFLIGCATGERNAD